MRGRQPNMMNEANVTRPFFHAAFSWSEDKMPSSVTNMNSRNVFRSVAKRLTTFLASLLDRPFCTKICSTSRFSPSRLTSTSHSSRLRSPSSNCCSFFVFDGFGNVERKVRPSKGKSRQQKSFLNSTFPNIYLLVH